MLKNFWLIANLLKTTGKKEWSSSIQNSVFNLPGLFNLPIFLVDAYMPTYLHAYNQLTCIPVNFD